MECVGRSVVRVFLSRITSTHSLSYMSLLLARSLGNNDIGGNGVRAIADALAHNGNLKSLKCVC